MGIDIDEDERGLLLEILSARRGSLREEIYHATTTDFKAGLKQQQKILQRLIERMESLRKEAASRRPALGEDLEVTTTSHP